MRLHQTDYILQNAIHTKAPATRQAMPLSLSQVVVHRGG